MFTRHQPFATAGSTLPSPANIKFLRYIKAWILPLDGSVDNRFCTINNSISLFVLNHSQQCSRHSGRYTMANIYTVTDIQPDISYQVRVHIHSGGYTKLVQDTHHDIHSGRYTAADTQQRIHSSR